MKNEAKCKLKFMYIVDQYNIVFVMNSLGHISGVDNARELNVKPT